MSPCIAGTRGGEGRLRKCGFLFSGTKILCRFIEAISKVGCLPLWTSYGRYMSAFGASYAQLYLTAEMPETGQTDACVWEIARNAWPVNTPGLGKHADKSNAGG